MGVVYRGRHVETGQEVAVKTVHVPYGSVLASLRSEIHALTRIRHPGIVRLVGEGIEAGLPWYAMELLEGRTLENRIGETWGAFARPGSHSSVPTAPTPFRAATEEILPPSDVSHTTVPVALQMAGSPPPAAGGRLQEMLVLIRRLCRPLTFIHSLGIVHRDLKPGNVFIRADGTPVLVDFGLVSLMTGAVGREALEVVAQMQGTLEYMSPEQIRLEVIDARSDLYALGCILYEVVTGRCPFLGRGKKELMARHQYEEPVPPSRLVAGVPPALDALVLRLLAKRPRDRIGHADDVAAMLEQLGAGADEPEAPRAGEAAPRPHLYRSQLHGRESVLEGLSTRLSAISQGAAGGLVLVSGESGLGKTALLGAIGREATMRGVQVISGECTPISTPGSGDADVRGGPLHLFRTLLQNVADQCREGGREMADRVFAGRGKLLGAYEPSLRYLPGQDSQPEPPAVPAQAERLRILEAMVATLGALAAERPLLLILDDLQWADDLSLDVMVAIAEAFAPSGGALAQRPLMVVGAYRVEEAGAGLDDLVGRPGIERIALGRLDEPVLRQIMGEMLAMTSPPRGFIRVLARRSGGNPFFAAEHLRAAVDERVLYRERGRWRLVDGDTDEESLYEARLPSPRSLGELIARRLEGLTPGARALVDVASVLGREADTELLVAVAGVDHDSALGSIRQLLARQVLEEVRPGRLRFCHDKLREIASGIIAAGRRQALHAVTAAVMEAQSAGSAGVGVAYSELAHHFREAGNLEKAIDYFEKAGAQAQRSFANRDAATFFGEALALDQKAGCPTSALRRAGWERQLGNANLALGRLVESQNHLLASVALLGAPMPSSKLGLVWGLLREATRQLWSRLRPRRMATVLPADRDRLLEAARAYDLLMPVSYFVSGELPRILYATLRNLNLAERGGPSPELALAYANAQVTTGLVPLFRLADAYGRRLHETLEGISDPAVRSWSYVLAGSYACGVGRWQDALAWGARAQAIGEEVGFPRRIEEGLGVQGAAHNLRGDFGKGRDISHALWQSALRGDPQTQVWGAAGEAQNCLVLGELERGLVAAGRAEACLAHNLGRPEKIICYGVLALAALRNGDKNRARESAGKALSAVTEGAPIAFYCITAYSCMAETLLELWKDAQMSGDQAEAETLRRLAKQACGEVKRSARVFPVHRPRALELAGRYQQLIGRTGPAVRTWQRALGAAQGAGLAYEEGLILADLAQLLPDDARRADLVARSQACFAQTGAVYEAGRVEAALGRAAAA
jgi:serine/threonine protein kinase/tetratricopeptide (TPR) repeat protein